MPRFIHTGDWQLGMRRSLLTAEAQARYCQARFDAIRAIGRVARDEGCDFVVVAGDVFETNRVGPDTIARALSAMGDAGVPFLLLPGNHDPLGDASVYRSSSFAERVPSTVTVLSGAEPVRPVDGVEVVGAPWTSKTPIGNPVIRLLDGLEPDAAVCRICVAHGPVDTLPPFGESEAVIPVDLAEKALRDGKIHYLALGDRHSVTSVGTTGKIWYAGTPEPTSFDEVKPGYILIADVDGDGVRVKERQVGEWNFLAEEFSLNSAGDVEALMHRLNNTPDKERTVFKLALEGCLGLADGASLAKGLDHAALLFAGMGIVDDGLAADADDFGELCSHLTGYAALAAEELRRAASGDGAGRETARDALFLLSRLAPQAEETA